MNYEVGEWGSGETVLSPYHPKTLSPYHPITYLLPPISRLLTPDLVGSVKVWDYNREKGQFLPE